MGSKKIEYIFKNKVVDNWTNELYKLIISISAIITLAKSISIIQTQM